MQSGCDRALTQQLEGYRLATAEILYHMPDHPGLLQSFIWQHYDQAPDFPRLNKFLHYWHREIEAVLHSVTVGRKQLIAPPKVKAAKAVFSLH
ncbi:MAG: Usg family protein [Kiloniellales bacterium]